MARNPDHTKEKLMAAAHAEFAAHGLAGARVERIASEANTNVQRIYAYFGSKNALFDAVITATMLKFTDALPMGQEDLTVFAGAVFDQIRMHPDNLRLISWARLESDRPQADRDTESTDADPVAYIAHLQQLGLVQDSWHPGDIFGVLIGMCERWDYHAHAKDWDSQRDLVVRFAASLRAAE